MRLCTQQCARKHAYQTKAEAQAVITYWSEAGLLLYPVHVYRCPFDLQAFHIGRTRARRGGRV